MQISKIEDKRRIESQRIIAFDVMRIISIFAVILLHYSSQRFYISFPSPEWEIRNVYDAMVRWGVPVFVMISGALFLDSNKKLSIKRLYTKNILRITCAFLFWSLIYLLYDILATNRQVTLGGAISSVVKGPFHLWFLKMLLGLYIMAPILKIIANNKLIEKYFLLLALITVFILPWFFKLVGFFNTNIYHLLFGFYEKMDIKIALGFTGFFMLGHYLKNKSFNPFIRKTIYILGLTSWICVIILTHFKSFYSYRGYCCLYLYHSQIQKLQIQIFSFNHKDFQFDFWCLSYSYTHQAIFPEFIRDRFIDYGGGTWCASFINNYIHLLVGLSVGHQQNTIR